MFRLCNFLIPFKNLPPYRLERPSVAKDILHHTYNEEEEADRIPGALKDA